MKHEEITAAYNLIDQITREVDGYARLCARSVAAGEIRTAKHYARQMLNTEAEIETLRQSVHDAHKHLQPAKP